MKYFANSDYTEGSYLAASRGLKPYEHTITKGTYLYRFVDLGRAPSDKSADGPWWFEYEHYKAITSFAERYGYSTGYVARLFAAILYEWSDVKAVVCAQVTAGPLFTWKAPRQTSLRFDRPKESEPKRCGNIHGVLTEERTTNGQPPISTKMTPTQGPLQVLQLYVPGLGPPHFKFSSLMSLEGWEHIQSFTPQFYVRT